MPEILSPDASQTELHLKAEIVRLNKMVRALMDRAERSIGVQDSDFSRFQTAIVLGEQVRSRTAQLEAALRENEKINRALGESEAKFRGLVSQSLVGIFSLEDDKFTYSNAKFNEIFGYSAEEVSELGISDTAIEADRVLVTEHIRKRLNGEVDRLSYVFRGLRKNGAVVNVETHSSCMNIGGKLVLIGLVMDVTERTSVEHKVQILQQELREQSTHDALTGLYNRRYLEESLTRELISAGRSGGPVSVILADLDHFKAINDQYGHAGGDKVLRVFAGLMKGRVRGSDFCCRYGGEEFLLVLPQIAKESAARRAEQMRSAVAADMVAYGAAAIAATASFGVATFPQDGLSWHQLIAAADSALYAAKAAGRNCVNVCPE